MSQPQGRVVSRLAGLFRFERVLALLLIAFPLPLWLFDDAYREANCPRVSPGPRANCRDSISAYWDMIDPKWFYVPLTGAALMFFVNGLVRADKHGYNAILGISLLGLVVLDHESQTNAHGTFAGIFFVAAMVFVAAHVTAVFGRSLDAWPQRGVLIGTLVAQLGVFLVVWSATSLFWAEWLELAVVALYYWHHSAAHDQLRPPDEPPDVIFRLFPRIHGFLRGWVRWYALDAVWAMVTGPAPSHHDH